VPDEALWSGMVMGAPGTPSVKPVWAGDLYPEAGQFHPVTIGQPVELFATVRANREFDSRHLRGGLWTNLGSSDPTQWAFLPAPMDIVEVHGNANRVKWVVTPTQAGVFGWTAAFSIGDAEHPEIWVSHDGILDVSASPETAAPFHAPPALPAGLPAECGEDWVQVLAGAAEAWQARKWIASAEALVRPFQDAGAHVEAMIRDAQKSSDAVKQARWEKRRMALIVLVEFFRRMASEPDSRHLRQIPLFQPDQPKKRESVGVLLDEHSELFVRVDFRHVAEAPMVRFEIHDGYELLAEFRLGADPPSDKVGPRGPKSILHLDASEVREPRQRFRPEKWVRSKSIGEAFSASDERDELLFAFHFFVNQMKDFVQVLPMQDMKPLRPHEAIVPDQEKGEPPRILVAEDEKSLQHLYKKLLEKAGYQVDVVSNAAAALGELRERAYALLLTDFLMPPGITGAGLISKVRELWPSLPVILATGVSDTNQLARDQAVPLLIKPFPPQVLHEAVRLVLAAG